VIPSAAPVHESGTFSEGQIVEMRQTFAETLREELARHRADCKEDQAEFLQRFTIIQEENKKSSAVVSQSSVVVKEG
jgi:hypothetical protein